MKNLEKYFAPEVLGNKTFNECNIIYDHVSSILDI